MYLVVSLMSIVELLREFIYGLRECKSVFVEIIGSVPNSKEIGGKLGGVVC